MMASFGFALVTALLVYVAACVAIAALGWWFNRK